MEEIEATPTVNIEGVEKEEIGEDLAITTPFNPNDIDIEVQNINIGTLVERMKYGEINFTTEFQRNPGLWTEVKQSQLIESILLGLNLPAFYFDVHNNSKWDVIDGLQRCWAIYKFCVDEKEPLRLKGLEFLGTNTQGELYLEGKTFAELERSLQRSILERTITINKFKKGDRRVRFILFKRLNTGGLNLTAQEIRNAVYQGKAINFINRLAQNETFKQVTEEKISSVRMEDRDFISRFIAFYLQDYRDYQPSLDEFVNKGIELLEAKEETLYKEIEQRFEASLKLAQAIWGNQAFRKPYNATSSKPHDATSSKRNPINKAYFEVIMSSFARLNEDDKIRLEQSAESIREKMIGLMKTGYDKSLSVATGGFASVKERHSKFLAIIKHLLDHD